MGKPRLAFRRAGAGRLRGRRRELGRAWRADHRRLLWHRPRAYRGAFAEVCRPKGVRSTGMAENLASLLDTLAGYLRTPDIASLSLPPEAYFSRALYDHEVREIFERSWLCVGREEYAPMPRSEER